MYFIAPQSYPTLNHAYNGPAYPHKQRSREHSTEMKYSNKTSNSYTVQHDQVSLSVLLFQNMLLVNEWMVHIMTNIPKTRHLA